MSEKLEKKLKRFHNQPDSKKLEELISISENDIDPDIIEFLLKIIEKEPYEKIRIKAILILKEIKTEAIIQKFMELYAFERENSVRLVLAETIGDMESLKTDDFLVKIATADENDVIRSIALRKLNERAKMDRKKLKQLLLEVIKNDAHSFPVQISLSIIPSYADGEILQILKEIYRSETKTKMKLLMFQTLEKIAENLGEELGIRKPIVEDSIDDKQSTKKKKRLLRRSKNNKKDEEYLFF